MTNPPKPGSFVEHIVQTYGDLLFDLCESVLWSPISAQVAFRAILKKLKKSGSHQQYTRYERAWVLRVAYETLQSMSHRHERRLTPAEQVMLDASLDIPSRIAQFDSYFHKLSQEDQVLLLLRDKFGIPYPEISAAMNKPEGSLKIKRQQALRSLEEWLWDRI